MKVLLISTNQLKPTQVAEWMPVVPLGAAYVAASLRDRGHEIEFLDLCFTHDQDRILHDVIAKFAPEVIGISFRNLEMVAYFNNVSFLQDLQSVVDICRRHSNARIVLGGSAFSIMPAEILKSTGLELGIIGEGEWSLPELLSRFERGQPYGDIPGIVCNDGTGVHITPPDHDRSLVGLPVPARDLIDHPAYISAGGTANLQTKRGCAFKCIYCTYPLIEGKCVRLRPPGEVAEEFRELDSKFGIREVYVVDSQFNYPLDHAKLVCEELVRIRDQVKVWWSCMQNPGCVDEELMLLLRLARCAHVDLGIDSASDQMLNNLGKGFTVGQVENAIKILKDYGLSFTAWILLGGPGETEQTILETLRFLADYEVSDVIFSIGVRVCPRTGIERLLCDDRRIRPDTDLLNPLFHLSMDAESMVSLVGPFCRGREGWHIAALPRSEFDK